MPRVVVPEVFHPILQFRYTLFTSKLPGATIFARSSQQPGFENNPIKVDYGNGYFKVKGKTNWDDLQVSCYQFEGITVPQFWLYLQQHQITKFAKDLYGSIYKHNLSITTLNPMGIPVGTWRLHGAFYNSVKFGEMDWGGEDVAQVDLSIAYDYAEYHLIL